MDTGFTSGDYCRNDSEASGEAQAQANRNQVFDMEESAVLSEGKKEEFFFAEADGVYIHETKKKRSHEIHHAISYEG